MFRFDCPKCHHAVSPVDGPAGRKLRCPACKAVGLVEAVIPVARRKVPMWVWWCCWGAVGVSCVVAAGMAIWWQDYHYRQLNTVTWRTDAEALSQSCRDPNGVWKQHIGRLIILDGEVVFADNGEFHPTMRSQDVLLKTHREPYISCLFPDPFSRGTLKPGDRIRLQGRLQGQDSHGITLTDCRRVE